MTLYHSEQLERLRAKLGYELWLFDSLFPAIAHIKNNEYIITNNGKKIHNASCSAHSSEDKQKETAKEIIKKNFTSNICFSF